MPARDLLEAWVILVGLSIGTVLIAASSEHAGALMAASVLALAGLKARVILSRYLGLAGSRFWKRAFSLVISIFLLLSFALYVFGSWSS